MFGADWLDWKHKMDELNQEDRLDENGWDETIDRKKKLNVWNR